MEMKYHGYFGQEHSNVSYFHDILLVHVDNKTRKNYLIQKTGSRFGKNKI